MDATTLVERFEHDGWAVLLYMTWDVFDRCLAGRAELFLDGRFRCRIALGKGFQEADDAQSDLRTRAKSFIADWSQREHSAYSDFSEL
jgi:hypothetical protein